MEYLLRGTEPHEAARAQRSRFAALLRSSKESFSYDAAIDNSAVTALMTPLTCQEILIAKADLMDNIDQ